MATMVKRLTIIFVIFILAACDRGADVQTYFTPGPDCENQIIRELNNARATVDIAVYSITNKSITSAIIATHNRGVRVRVITDRAQSNIRGTSTGALRDAGIAVITNTRHKIMHHKFAIFDARRVVSGSYNWTENASRRNTENCNFWNIKTRKYPTQFEYMWELYKP